MQGVWPHTKKGFTVQSSFNLSNFYCLLQQFSLLLNRLMQQKLDPIQGRILY